MEITVTRSETRKGATIGQLRINGVHLCFTLEDAVREIQGEPVESWKVAGETAIPRGRYQVIVNESARFGRLMPLLVNVPGFSGVRIHPGNSAADTEGCILLGLSVQGNLVLQSRAAFEQFFKQLQAAILNGEQVHLSIA
jgi:hypothetical protein